MSGYEKLKIYQQALQGIKIVHELFEQHPQLKRDFELKNQIFRAAISIASNIAEGYGRGSKKDFMYFISVSLGSINEVKTHIDIITIIHQVDTQKIKQFYIQLGKQTWTFRQTLLKPKTDN